MSCTHPAHDAQAASPSKGLFIRIVLPPANQGMQIPIKLDFFPISQQKSTQQDTSTH